MANGGGGNASITLETKAPTGLSISRNGMDFTLKWNIKDANYDRALEVQWRFNSSEKWQSWIPTTTSGKRSTSHKVTASASNYNPFTSKLMTPQFRVRGRRAKRTSGDITYLYKTSDWSKTCKMDLDPPKIVTAYASRYNENTARFTWYVDNEKDDKRPFTRIELRKAVIKNKNDDNFSGVSWGSVSSYTQNNSHNDLSIAPTSFMYNADSYTGAFLFRACGPGGNTAWKPYYKVFAKPIAPTITSATKSGNNVSFSWTATSSFAFPIDGFRTQYKVGVPATQNLSPPSGDWTTVSGTIINKSRIITVPALTADNAVWVRAVSVNEGSSNPSTARFVAMVVKPLASANAVTVEYNTATTALKLTASNPSSIPGTNVVVKLSSGTYAETYTIPSADGYLNTTNANIAKYSTMTLTAWVQHKTSGGAVTNSTSVSRTYNVKTESTNPAVFVPTGLSAKAGATAGTVALTWTDAGIGATSAEASYSTDPNAWSGSSYTTVTAAATTSTTVTEIAYDIPYYFRVRQTNSHGTTNWSAMISYTLKASDIPVPILTLAQGPSNDSIRVQWSWQRWASATGIELSWSDSENAWNGSASKTTQEISKVENTGTYYLTGLRRGRRWYVHGKFTYGNVSSSEDIKSFMLTVTPTAPTNVTLVKTDLTTARLSWTWSWEDAEKAEISWSDNPGAWDSTAGASSQTVTRDRTWIDLSGLEAGKVWYARVRFEFDDYYANSEIVSVDMRTTPVTPVVALSHDVVPAMGGRTDISWTYSNDDGTEQASAIVCLAEVDEETGDVTVGDQITGVSGANTAVALDVEAAGLEGDTDYYLVVQTLSTAGVFSEWSAPVKLAVSYDPQVTITATSLVEVEIPGEEEGDEYTENQLQRMPLTMTVETGNVVGAITGYIVRSAPYFIDRPDERVQKGYEGELIAQLQLDEDGTFTFDMDDLIGNLDDGAPYRLVALVAGKFGKTAEASVDFVVAWDHQAVTPDATVVVDTEQMIAKITATAPETALTGDTVDIYRLSADRPELIVQGGAFGTTYVDPYPAFGIAGGHRIVYRTLYGDFVTEDGHLAMVDFLADEDAEYTETVLPDVYTVIDFGGSRVTLEYNIEFSSSWEKDFKETKYLGGAVQGDWNQAVSRKGSVSSVSVTSTDKETINGLRRLAVYPGICHVRTPDGSSFAADVQVKEDRSYNTGGQLASFSLDITRVDSEGFDGMTLDEWNAGGDDEEQNG